VIVGILDLLILLVNRERRRPTGRRFRLS